MEDIENNTWVCIDNLRNFSLSVQLYSSQVSAANEWDVELKTQGEIPYYQATEYVAFSLSFPMLVFLPFKKNLNITSVLARIN